jgi:hypothetical protein
MSLAALPEDSQARGLEDLLTPSSQSSFSFSLENGCINPLTLEFGLKAKLELLA